jgi:tetratricopeptide (TPR) repeat protein
MIIMSGSLQKRILTTILLLLLVPMVVISIVSINQVDTLGTNTGNEAAASLEAERTKNLQNKSVDAGEYIKNYFHQVETDLDRLVAYEREIFEGNISILGTRPSYKQGVADPGDLALSSKYNLQVSKDYSDYAHPNNLTAGDQVKLSQSAYMDYICKNVYHNAPDYVSILLVYSNGISRMFPYIKTIRSGTEDRRTDDWYIFSKASGGKANFSEPMNGPLGPSMYIGKAVYYKNNTLIGGIAIEVKLKAIQNSLGNMSIFNQGYLSLITLNGKALTHKNLLTTDYSKTIQELEVNSAEFNTIIDNAKLGKTNTTTFLKSAKKWVVAYAPVGIGGFSCLAFVPDSEIIEPGNSLKVKLAELTAPTMTSFIILLICLVVGMVIFVIALSKYVTRPIRDLTLSVQTMGRGDLSKEIKIDKRHKKNEIGLLAQSFQNLLVTMRLGNSSYYQGDLNIAFNNYKAALQLFQTLDNTKGIGTCLNNLGNIYRNWGDYDKSLNCYNKSIEIGQQLNDKTGLSARFNNRGLLFLTLENYPNAESDFQAALAIDSNLNDNIRIATRYRNMGILKFHQNQLDRSKNFLKLAFDLDNEEENSPGIAENHFQLARVDISTKDFNSAEEHLKKALDIAKKIENLPLLKEVFVEMVEVYENLNKTPQLKKAQTELEKLNAILVKPKDVVFVIDLSGSMEEQGKIVAAKTGALEVFDVAINPSDNIAILGFHGIVETILNMTHKEGNGPAIRNVIKNIRATPYQTMFYDAVAQAIKLLSEAPNKNQKWIVALTDGLDNCSVEYTSSKLAEFIDGTETPMNIILIGVGRDLREVAQDFTKIVNASVRGKYIPIYSSKNVQEKIEKAFKQVQEIMAFSEIEGFSPEDS